MASWGYCQGKVKTNKKAPKQITKIQTYKEQGKTPTNIEQAIKTREIILGIIIVFFLVMLLLSLPYCCKLLFHSKNIIKYRKAKDPTSPAFTWKFLLH